MTITVYNTNGQESSRPKHAFGWLLLFVSFPKDSWEIDDTKNIMLNNILFYIKGHATLTQDGVVVADLTPGRLSSEFTPYGLASTFRVDYLEDTTRICFSTTLNKGLLPTVSKIQVSSTEPEEMVFSPGQKFLVCVGSVDIEGKIFAAEKTITVVNSGITALLAPGTLLLEFLD